MAKIAHDAVEQILLAAEDVLRRFGPGKATVVDVARALGVSHGSVYRHFASKVALREAVTERWLNRVHAPLRAIVEEDTPAPARLQRWLSTLFAEKRKEALDDPELFATYLVLATEASEMVDAHIADLTGQLARIIAAGVASGDFVADSPDVAARAVFDATTRYHDPVHAAGWSNPGVDAAFTAVVDLTLRSLSR
jgi:AcrR family transcriptional regulator